MSLRARAILVLIVALLSLGMAYPSLVGDERGLNLGLDLQGGIHWLLSIDRDAALDQELDAVRASLKDMAQDDATLELESVEKDGDRLIVPNAPLANLENVLATRFDGLETEVDGADMIIRIGAARQEDVLERGARQAKEVLARRADKFGVREPIIALQGNDRVLVQMPGEVDPERARDLITSTTFLEFKKVLGAAPNEELLAAQYPEGLPADTEIVVQKTDDLVTEAVLVQNPSILTGDKLEDARLGYDGRTNEPVVNFVWNAAGTEVFREFTKENIGQRMAVILDGDVLTAPTIQSRIGRRGQISGAFDQQGAADLAVNLRSGALPIPLIMEEERTVGPALGADSIANGIRSILVGGALVILFMAVYYSVSGMLANVALLLNIVIIIGLMSLVQATLTLPGIAGLVLTVGMAVDANVIIFERIREELRGGKSVRNAIQIGFNRSRLTIIDANVTTALAALLLYYYGRGPVKGFGVTLGIGIFSSVFCALVVTRLLVEWMGQRTEKLRI